MDEDRLEKIFKRQAELMKKYEDIERKNGFHWLVGLLPVDLNDKFAQARIKDCAWRIIEELAEMLDSIMCHPGNAADHEDELADALHFLVELCIVVGLTPEDIITRALRPVIKGEDMLEEVFDSQYTYVMDIDMSTAIYTHLCCAKFMRNLGYSCNYLKNKPWKTSHRITDVDKFLDQLSLTFVTFFSIPIAMGVTPSGMYYLYFEKAQVNQERQEGNY